MNDKLKEAKEKLLKRQEELHKVMPVPLGETADAGYFERTRIADPTRTPLCENYMKLIAPEYKAFEEAIRAELAAVKPFPAAPPIPSDKFWLWGGPTPEWGGSLQKDTLVRAAQWIHADNGVYVYGPTTEEMIAVHSPLKNMLAMVTTTCRAPGQQPETDAECAEKLSRLSLKYPNITGGMMDDMTAAQKDVTQEKIEQVATVSRALKKHNPKLKLFGVVYEHELNEKNYSGLQPYLDGVNLWFWYQEKLLELEEKVDLCRRNFPGKEILLGLFIHDYGTSDAGALSELLIHELKGARALMAAGKINGLVVLGDRELLKWPEQAGVVKGFMSAR